MAAQNTFLFLSLLLFFPTLSCSDEAGNHELEALIRIKNELNDPHGALINWDEYAVDPCSWFMITCSPDNLVTALDVSSQGLSGTLSGMIANLTNLREVLLQNNSITGQIPSGLGHLPNLQTLDLSNNRFSGHVPDSLSLLDGLQYLNLSYNNLSGPVPKFTATSFNIVGNPLICGSHPTEGCYGSSMSNPLSFTQDSSPSQPNSKRLAIALGVSFSCFSLFLLALGYLF